MDGVKAPPPGQRRTSKGRPVGRNRGEHNVAAPPHTPATKSPGPRHSKVRKYRKNPGATKRRADEDRPGPDYLSRMRKLGPRRRESLLSFEMRMAAIEKGRQMIYDAARSVVGDMSPMKSMCKRLGLTQSNLPAHLRTTGISYDDLYMIFG